MAPAKGKLQSPWQLYWEFRLQAVKNRLKFSRTLLEERGRWLKDWEERATSFVEEIEEEVEEAAEEAEEQAEKTQKRRSSRSRSRGDDNPRG
jgi:hypothetical protein